MVSLLLSRNGGHTMCHLAFSLALWSGWKVGRQADQKSGLVIFILYVFSLVPIINDTRQNDASKNNPRIKYLYNTTAEES